VIASRLLAILYQVMTTRRIGKRGRIRAVVRRRMVAAVRDASLLFFGRAETPENLLDRAEEAGEVVLDAVEHLRR
jgi:hypothetical protein